MKLKYSHQYQYNNTKEFPCYLDQNNNKYLLKETDINNYDLLLKIKETAIDHENILGIEYFYEKDNKLYYFIKLLEGITLEEVLLKNKQLSKEQLDTIFLQILLGLQSLHQNNIIHQDIKPANIFITKEEVVKVIDFDISQDLNQLDTPNGKGTKGYAAPEQYGFALITKRVDIFSFGKLIESVVKKTNPELELDYKTITSKCLKLDPDDRFQDVSEIIKLIRHKTNRFTPSQKKQLENAYQLGLNEEVINKLADPELLPKQIGVLKHSYHEKIDINVIKLMYNKKFSSKQMWQIKQGSLDGLKLKQIERYADSKYDNIMMEIFRNGILLNKTTLEIEQQILKYQELIKENNYDHEELMELRTLLNKF
jgi:serine/threonine protein kinase